MEPKKENFFKEIFKFAIIALLIVVPIRFYIAQPFVVSGASMFPTFDNGQYLIVDQITYRFSAPQRSDVIIFRYPLNPSTFFIKRIIGLPGESVEMSGKTVIVRNSENPDGFTIDEPYLVMSELRDDFLTVTLGIDEYFVLGDNRIASSDSRVWGPLEEKYIIGRALLRLFPISQTDVFPGGLDNK
jgi:signal peptidase I